MLTVFVLGKDVLFQARMKTTMVSMRTYYTQHDVHSSVKFIPLHAAKRTRKLSSRKPATINELAKRGRALRLLQSRKRKIMVILMSLVTLILNPPRDRMYWMKPHSDDWFKQLTISSPRNNGTRTFVSRKIRSRSFSMKLKAKYQSRTLQCAKLFQPGRCWR